MPRFIVYFIILGCFPVLGQDDLQNLAKSFFQWRAVTQPAGGDDIPRVERPTGWVPDFSSEALAEHRKQYRHFRQRLDALDKNGWGRAEYVDFLSLRSAIERVHWELDVLRHPHGNPDFYVHQTLGALYELLLIHSPITADRSREMITRLASFPKTLSDARANLTAPVRPFAEIALANLKDVGPKMTKTLSALKKVMATEYHAELEASGKRAIAALEGYVQWLEKTKHAMTPSFSLGRDAYVYFLKNIALIPYSPEELLAMGRLEWHRSVAFEAYAQGRNANEPPADIFKSAAEQIAKEAEDEAAIRKFLEAYGIMSVPDWLGHYHNKKIPDHIAPLAHMGVVDDLTSETRLDEDAISYIPEPSPDLSFFRLATAKDPRPIIVHEGVPGHYYQMARSWKNPNPIRRRYIDSGANEGIGFYVEELLLQYGLFDDRPRTREIIYRFMRLRALRVEVDIQLALGEFTIEQAGERLAKMVPMDRETAIEEAGFFAYNPRSGDYLSDRKNPDPEIFERRPYRKRRRL